MDWAFHILESSLVLDTGGARGERGGAPAPIDS